MRLLLYIVCLLPLFSCTKSGKNISVTGLILNPVTGEGYENIEVELLTTDGGLPGGYKTVKRVYTNKDGYFEMHHLGVVKNYYVSPEIGGRFPIGWYQDNKQVAISRMPLNKGENTNGTFYMVPIGRLTLHIQNINCEGATDEMQFHSRMQWEDEYDGWSTIREGCYDYLSPQSSEVPTGKRYYEVKVTRSSGVSYHYTSVFIADTGTAHVELFY